MPEQGPMSEDPCRSPTGPHVGLIDLRREGSEHQLPADRARAAPGGRSERPCHPARRRGLRRLECLRWAVRDAELREAREPAASATTASTRRPCARRHGRRCSPAATTTPSAWAASRRSRPPRPGNNSLRPNTKAPLARDAQAERLLDVAVRQVPRGAGVAVEPDGAVRHVADRFRVRVLLRLHRRRGQPVVPVRSTRARHRSSRPRPRRRATTSPRTSPITRSTGCARRRR